MNTTNHVFDTCERGSLIDCFLKPRESLCVIRTALESECFKEMVKKAGIAIPMGIDESIRMRITDLAMFSHLLVAGTLGSGKSVFLHSVIASILYQAGPEDVKLLLIDPKMIEFDKYDGIPHLIQPRFSDPNKAADALECMVTEMNSRYEQFEKVNARNLEEYNDIVRTNQSRKPIPRIVIIVDEFSGLMMVQAKRVEEAVVRLCQKSRAAGIHMILATQCPRADVITGLIKANCPSRVAFKCSSRHESRIILDQNGAEILRGLGDMLFYPAYLNEPIRLQGFFISGKESKALATRIKNKGSSFEGRGEMLSAECLSKEEEK